MLYSTYYVVLGKSVLSQPTCGNYDISAIVMLSGFVTDVQFT